jgi:hypothetical protein
MTAPGDTDRLIRAFLDEGQTELPDRAYDAVRAHIDRTRQRVVIGPWREPHMSTFARVAIAAAAVLAIAVVLIQLRPSASVGGPAPSPVPTPTPIPLNSHVVVPATANIFAAGHDRTPSPGGGGGGTMPPATPLPGGTSLIVTFPKVTGEVNPIVNAPEIGFNGPGGDMTSDTDVESFGGISGMVHHGNGMFLVGVFLTDDVPADPAPERLDFTDNEDFNLLEPEIGQTFFIGDGIGRGFLVPPGATRVFLGFVNAYTQLDPLSLTHGKPGYYGNNSGELEVEIEVSIE